MLQVSGNRGTKVFDTYTLQPGDVQTILRYVQERDAVAHNANFEVLWARDAGVELRLDDTMIQSRVLYGGTETFKQLRHSLADVAERELEVELDKTEQTSDWSGQLTEEQLEYAKTDAEITRTLYYRLQKRLREEQLEATYSRPRTSSRTASARR